MCVKVLAANIRLSFSFDTQNMRKFRFKMRVQL